MCSIALYFPYCAVLIHCNFMVEPNNSARCNTELCIHIEQSRQHDILCRTLAISRGMIEIASGMLLTMAAMALVRAVPLFSDTPERERERESVCVRERECV